MDALTSTAVACHIAHAQQLDCTLEDLYRHTSHCLIAKSYAATPMMLRFRQVQDLLCPHARYTVLDAQTNRWQIMGHKDFRAMHPKAIPQKGVLETLAQTVTLHWSEVSAACDSSHKRSVHTLPQIIERASASTLFNAVEGAAFALPVDKIIELGSKLRFVLLSDTSGSAAAMRLKRARTQSSLQQQGNIFYFEKGCDVHMVNVILGNATKEVAFVGHIHVVAFAASIPQHRNSMIACLRRMVAKGNVYIVYIYIYIRIYSVYIV